MRTWSIKRSTPLYLTIAADSRLSSPQFTNDHIWELKLDGNEPPAMAIQTTYGLRAHRMRLFPRFVYKGKGDGMSDPNTFYRPPAITHFFPNYISLFLTPFPGIDVLAEYWVPSSNAITGRFTFTNHSVLTESFRFELAGILNPIGTGEGLSPSFFEGFNILKGSLEGITPVCIMSGTSNAVNSPFTTLCQDIELFPGNFRSITWAMGSLSDAESSFYLAKNLLERSWDAEISRIEILNTSQAIEITTGNPLWDEIFALSQRTAFGLIFQEEHNLSIPPFVLSRQPDQGFSLRGDGSDFPLSWNGPTALDAYILFSMILPGGEKYCQKILQAFLTAPHEDGFINWKALSTNQYQQVMCQPLLASLALKIFEFSNDLEWLTAIYPVLYRFFMRWFSEEFDHDSDGFPEWDHPNQSGLPESPLYDLWHTNSQYVSIKTIESPALATMLYQECASLLKISALCNTDESTAPLNEKQALLAQNILACWDAKNKRFQYRDYLNHTSLPGDKLGAFQNGKHKLDRDFHSPIRLVLNLALNNQDTRPLTISISGKNKKGNFTERISFRDLTWGLNQGTYTTKNDFLKIYTITIGGLGAEDKICFNIIDYTTFDISLLLPLWSELPLPKEILSKLKTAVKSKYLKSYGLPVCASSAPNISLYWNILIGEGLLNRGYIDLAVTLVTSIMSALSNNIEQYGAFFEKYHCESATPQGDRYTLSSLAPLGLFLKTLGIQRLTSQEVVLSGFNPYPWPVTIKYRNLNMTIHAKDATITFPNGQVANITGKGIHKISLD
jgi:hypothetical protein